MTTINLKDYYPWYLTNEYIEVTDEVAEALMASKRAEAARERAEEGLRQKQSIHEYYHSKAALARAMARLKTRRE